jgi:hypothetical protein
MVKAQRSQAVTTSVLSKVVASAPVDTVRALSAPLSSTQSGQGEAVHQCELNWKLQPSVCWSRGKHCLHTSTPGGGQSDPVWPRVTGEEGAASVQDGAVDHPRRWCGLTSVSAHQAALQARRAHRRRLPPHRRAHVQLLQQVRHPPQGETSTVGAESVWEGHRSSWGSLADGRVRMSRAAASPRSTCSRSSTRCRSTVTWLAPTARARWVTTASWRCWLPHR